MLANIIRNTKKTGIGGGGGGIVTGGDPYYSAVSLLLAMDGTNGSTTFTDSGPSALTVTAANATISTTQAKYGGSSGSFTGTSSNAVVPSSTLFNFNAGDFTIECWIYWLGGGGSPGTIFTTAFPTDSQGVFIGLLSSGAFNYLAGNGTWAFNSTTTSNAISANQWYHIAYNRSGSTFTVYINGVASGSTTSSPTLTNSNNQAVIGGRNVLGQYFRGFIDDLRISQFARYTSTFTPPTAALPTTASSTPADPYYGYTSLLLHMDGANASTAFVDSGPSAFTLTRYGTAAVSTTQSKYGGASAYFDGSGARLGLSSTAIDFGTGDFTAECWIYLNATPLSAYGQIMGKQVFGVSASWIINLDASRVMSFVWNNAVNVLSTGTALSLNQWYHIAASRSGSTIKLFINGTQFASTAISYTFASSTEFTVCSSSNDAAAARLNAYIDDLRITKYARYTANFTPPTQAHLEYANGNDRYFSNVSLLLHMDGVNGSTTFTDNSANALAVTASGTPTISTSQSVFGGSSLALNGSSYLTVANNAANAFGLGDFTIECWVNFSALPANNVNMGIANVMTSASAATTTMWWFGLNNAAGTLRLQLGRHGNGLLYAYSNWTPSLNTWYHVAATRSSSSVISLFINGVSQSVTSSGSNWANDFSATGILAVGHIASAVSMNGYIDDFRLTKGVARTFTAAPTAAFPNA